MHVDHRLAAVEAGEHRGKGGVSEPLVAIARHQPDAVGLEHIEGIFDLLEAAFGVGQRQRGEQAEAPGVIRDKTRQIFVAAARQFSRGRRASPNQMPGLVTDATAVRTPLRSISSSDRCTDQSAIGGRFLLVAAIWSRASRIQIGGVTW